MVSFIFSTTFSVREILPRRDSTECQMLGLYSQFSFYKMLKALQVLIFTYSILEKRPKALLTMFLIDVDRLMLPRPLQDVIFKHIF